MTDQERSTDATLVIADPAGFDLFMPRLVPLPDDEATRIALARSRRIDVRYAPSEFVDRYNVLADDVNAIAAEWRRLRLAHVVIKQVAVVQDITPTETRDGRTANTETSQASQAAH